MTVAAELSDIRGGPFDALDLARLAVEVDPIDAFAAAGLAKALMRRGEAERGHAEALRAARLATGHRDRPWWNMLCCVTAVQCGRYAEALGYARAAHDLAPNFRPPMRFLLGLYFHAGEEEAVVRTAARLRRLEPDFEAAALKDPDYPLRLQGTPLLAVARLRAVLTKGPPPDGGDPLPEDPSGGWTITGWHPRQLTRPRRGRGWTRR